ncbi:MAG: DALR anticodon-binding domain-containing protein, partial [Pseudomonadota bacterium]
LIDAVLALGQNDDIALIVRRVEALTAFLDRAEGADLSAGLKRANNILTIEEKKIGQRIESDADGALLKEPAERELAAVIAKVKFDTQAAINVENFEGAMNALSELRGPVDQFFDAVTVNDADDSLRLNRLKLLSQIRDATVDIADFSLIAGNAS